VGLDDGQLKEGGASFVWCQVIVVEGTKLRSKAILRE
jgi:hypothetical protein